MRIILAFFSILMVGCSTKAIDESHSYVHLFSLDVDPGYFEEERLDDWSIGQSVCVELRLDKPYNTTKYLASTGVLLKAKDVKNQAKVFLYTKDNDSEKLSFSYVYKIGSDRPFLSEIIPGQIDVGRFVRFSVHFPNDYAIGININGTDFSYTLPFVPETMYIVVSSAKVDAKILSMRECDITKRST